MGGKDDNERNGGFGLPPDYFDRLKEKVSARIARDEEMSAYPWLRDNDKTPPFSVPEGYFAASSVRLELTDRRQLLNMRKDVFSVPDNYFESSGGRLRERLHSQRRSGNPRVLAFRRHATLAMAAVLLVTIFVAVYMFVFRPVEKDCGTVACIDRKEIIHAAEIDELDADELTPAVNADKLGKLLARPRTSPEEDIE
jgi:hypothetical protein